MENYPKPISKKCSKTIFDQMENAIYKINEREGKYDIGFFCHIKYENEKIPVLIANYKVINEKYISRTNKIKIRIKNEIKNIILGDIYYFNKDNDLSIIEIKEDKNIKINFLQLDENLFKDDIELIYNGESIYVMQCDKNKNIFVSYGIIKYLNVSDLTCFCNVNSSQNISPIFNLSNNKLIGIFKNKLNCYSKGIIFKFIINEFINRYKNSFHEIDIMVNIDKDDINKKIYFLSKNFDKENNITKLNAELYKNNNKINFEKYFIPDKIGKYFIKLKFKLFITDCSYMFAECANIININFIHFYTKDITSMKCMFYNCKNLRYINLFCFEIKKEINISEIFYGCDNLTNLDLSSFDNKYIKLKSEDKIQGISLFKDFEIYPLDCPNYNYSYKIIFVGNSEAKKTLIVYSALNKCNVKKNDIIDKISPTLGFDYIPFIFKYKNEIFKLEVWDTCGQEAYRSLIKSFFVNTSIAVITYAINDKNSFDSVNEWLRQCKIECSPETKFFLVGNKMNINEEEKIVSFKQGMELKEKNHLDFFMEVSKNNVMTLFYEMTKALYEEQQKNKNNNTKVSTIYITKLKILFFKIQDLDPDILKMLENITKIKKKKKK